jgi:hypothetical protein
MFDQSSVESERVIAFSFIDPGCIDRLLVALVGLAVAIYLVSVHALQVVIPKQ